MADPIAADLRFPMIVACDIADVAVRALRQRDRRGVIVREVLGERDLTGRPAPCQSGGHRHSGEAAVRAVHADAEREHTRPDGSIRRWISLPKADIAPGLGLSLIARESECSHGYLSCDGRPRLASGSRRRKRTALW
jgi:hypothetical protein